VLEYCANLELHPAARGWECFQGASYANAKPWAKILSPFFGALRCRGKAASQNSNTPLLDYSNTPSPPLLHHSALFPLVTRHSFIVILFTMKKLVVLGTLLPVILLTSSIAAAFDLGKVHNLVVFGDSLSDNGNTIAAISLEITALSLAGAQQFLVINVPDISLTPDIIAKGTATVQAAKQFVTSVDTQLQNRIPLLASLLGVKIDLIDANPLFTQLVNDPASFGFKNSTGEAYNPSTHKEVKHPNQYVLGWFPSDQTGTPVSRANVRKRTLPPM
jgi:hypothetical protein